MQKESLRGRTAAPLLAQGAAVSLMTVLAVAVTAGAVIRNRSKYDAFFLPSQQTKAAAQDENTEQPAIRRALSCLEQGDYAAAEPLLQQALRDAEAAEPDQSLSYPATAAIRLRLGILCYDTDRFAEAKDYLTAAKAEFQPLLPENAAEILLTDGQLGLCELSDGAETDGWAMIAPLKSVAEQAESAADRMDACNLLAKGCLLTGQTADAVKWQEQLLQTAENTKNETAYLPNYRMQYAAILLADGQKEPAAECCRNLLGDKQPALSAKQRTSLYLTLAAAAAGTAESSDAVKAAEAAYREETHSKEEDAAFSLRLADVYEAAGDSKAAVSAARDALSAAKGTGAEANCLIRLGNALEAAADSAEALESYESALTLSRKNNAEADIAAAQASICRVCRMQEDYARSLEAGLEADKLLWKLYGKYNARRIPLLSEMALSYGAQLQFTSAKQYAEAVLKIISNLPYDRKECVLGDLTMGRIRTLENNGQSAIQYLKRAAEAADAACGPDSPTAIRAQIWLADACMRCREYEQADAAYAAAADRLEQSGNAAETVTAVRAVQTAVGGIRPFLADRLKVLSDLWDQWTDRPDEQS